MKINQNVIKKRKRVNANILHQNRQNVIKELQRYKSHEKKTYCTCGL